jgi:pentatricopeptide repeat protein
MISLYGQKGQYEKAKELFLSLWQRSAPQSLYILNTMIGVCIKCKQIGDAVQIFEDMEKRGMAYDDVTVSTMVNAYSKAGVSGANPSLNKQSNTCGTITFKFKMYRIRIELNLICLMNLILHLLPRGQGFVSDHLSSNIWIIVRR